MSIQWKLFPSLLFCHITCSGGGVDETTAVMVAFDPKETVGFTSISTLGTSRKQSSLILFKFEIDENECSK